MVITALILRHCRRSSPRPHAGWNIINASWAILDDLWPILALTAKQNACPSRAQLFHHPVQFGDLSSYFANEERSELATLAVEDSLGLAFACSRPCRDAPGVAQGRLALSL